MSIKSVFIVTVSLHKKGDGISKYRFNPIKRLILAVGEKDAEDYMQQVVETYDWIKENQIKIRKINVKRISIDGISTTEKFRVKQGNY